MVFPSIAEEWRRSRLTPPEGRLRVILDTDTYNEVDDQFAVVHALLSPDRISLEAITAAPFHNNRSDGPADGMEKSYEEIIRLLERLGVSERDRVFRGSTAYLLSREKPIESDAAEAIVEMSKSGEGPVYVVAIGAITNVASAILMDPGVIKRIVVVWLGGQPRHWPSALEFNLKQDVRAAQLVLDSGVPFVQIPCATVASHLLTTIPEMEAYVKSQGEVGQFLYETFAAYRKNQYARSKEIWDISATGYVIDPTWVPVTIVSSPILTDQVTWSVDEGRHSVAIAHSLRRDAIFGDLFRKMKRFAAGALAPSWA